MSNGLFNWKSALFGLGVALILLAAPLFLPRFYIYFLALILVTGLLATSLNLVLGFGGMYQFHHAVFYGIGAYTLALVLTQPDRPSGLGMEGRG